MPYPSNDLICKCFLRSFAENKCYFFKAMASLCRSGYCLVVDKNNLNCECKELLCALRNRQLSHGTAIEEVYTDNCCTIKAKLHSVFGPNVHAYLHIFHAAQRITKTITKRHPLCKLVMKDMQMLFRDPRYKGHQRNTPTPSIDVLLFLVHKVGRSGSEWLEDF